jgi:hypothetical protein
MANARPSLLLLLAFGLALPGCARQQKRLSPEDVRSHLHAAISLSAETELLLDYVDQGRSTSSYAAGHAHYLQLEAARLQEELGRGTPEPGVEPPVIVCRQQLRMLEEELRQLPSRADDSGALREMRRRVAGMRARLEQARAGE